jgi:hypothetical protein
MLGGNTDAHSAKKEAAMSSIQANSVVVRGLLALKGGVPKGESAVSKRPGARDSEMAHAWSIGTTRAAQQAGPASEKKSDPSANACPPEVYIG